MTSVLIASHGKQKVASLLSQLQREKGIRAAFLCVECPAMLPAQLVKLRPEVILLDAELFDAELAPRLRLKNPALKIILLLGQQQNRLLEGMPELHVDGSLPLDVPPGVCAKAIQAVAEGELWLPRCVLANAYRSLLQKVKEGAPSWLDDDPAENRLSLLTDRERQLSKLVAKGLANKEIAREMDISVDTVKKHLKNIYSKFGVHRRSQIASLLYRPSPRP